MQMSLVVQQIMGVKIADDSETVTIAMRSGPDTVHLVFPTPDLDGVIEILTQARDGARNKGLTTDNLIQARLPKSVAVTKSEKHVGAVMLIFDRALPTRAVFIIGHQAARDVGKKMLALGREAGDESRLIEAARSA